MLMAAKVPAVAESTRQAMQDGMSVVIGLQSTGAANLDETKAANGMLSQCMLVSASFRRAALVTMSEESLGPTIVAPQYRGWGVTATLQCRVQLAGSKLSAKRWLCQCARRGCNDNVLTWHSVNTHRSSVLDTDNSP